MAKVARDCDGDSEGWVRGGSSREAETDIRAESNGEGDPGSGSKAFWVSRGSRSCPQEGDDGRGLSREDSGDVEGGKVYESGAVGPGIIPFRKGSFPLGRILDSVLGRRPDVAARRASSSSSTRRCISAISDRIGATLFSTKASTTSLSLSCCCVKVCMRALDLWSCSPSQFFNCLESFRAS